jgi:hypothetical protein
MTLVELLRQLGVEHRESGRHHHVTPGWVGLDCPNCSPGSHRFRLGIHLRTLATSCWSCGGSSLTAALRDVTRRPWGEIKALLRGLDGDVGIAEASRVVGSYAEPPGVVDLLPAHRKYLRDKRRFDPDEIARVWGVRAIGNAARRAWRLFIPVVTPDGRPASWTTRAIGDASLRYVSADPSEERVPLKHTLYGAHLAERSVIVVEGPTDAWRVGPGAVATYGVRYTEVQVALLARYPTRVVCYDREPAAQERARALTNELAAFPGTTYNVILSGDDPDESPESEIRELRERFLRA